MSKRLALVIGNAAYDPAKSLNNPKNDAEAVAGILKRLGFQLVTIGDHKEFHADLTLMTMSRALADFSVAAENAETAIVYFAGHGLEVDGQNYLVPVDAALDHVRRLYFETIRLADVRQTLNRASHFSLVILDACRDDPFNVPMRGLEHTRSGVMGRGLAREEAFGNHGVAFAAKEGTTARDSLKGSKNSPYTQALIKHLETPNVEIRLLFGRIKDEVAGSTGNQVPTFYSDFGGQELYLKGHGQIDVRPVPSNGAGDTVYGELKQLWDDLRIELCEDLEIIKSYAAQAKGTRWADMAEARLKTVEASRKARDDLQWNKATFENSVEVLEAYLGAWPTGAYAADAKVKIELLRDEQAWLQVASGSLDSVYAYLRDFPRGAHVEIARSRIAEAEEAERKERERQAAEEAYRREERLPVDATDISNPHGRWFLPAAGKAEWFQDIPGGPEMVVAPRGSFMMGSPEDEPQRESWQAGTESPRHNVTIAHPFAVGRHKVTRGQFAAFVDATDHGIEPGAYVWTGTEWKKDPSKSWSDPGFHQDDSHPVVCVNWHDAKAYAAWLSEKSRQSYRLLSEAEWEYVCRAGTSTPFWHGTSITPAQANYDGNHLYKGGGSKGEWRQRTVPVESFEANPWGLYQVHGNAWEWCEDAWHETYAGAPDDGSPWLLGGDQMFRVLRGGSWISNPHYLRAAIRYRDRSGNRYSYVGFRVARTLL